MGHAQKNGSIFLCVGGGSLPLSGYFAFGLNTPLPPPFMIKPRICLDFSRVAGGTTPPSKKIKKEFDVSLRHAYKPASPTG